MQLANRKGIPFLVSAEQWIGESGKIDLHIPSNRFEILVKDATTGRGIDAALVQMQSHFGEGGQSVVSARDHTGKDGRLELPPIRPGSLELTARADGYAEAASQIEISESEKGRTVEFRLRPQEKGDPVQLLLTGGLPAAGAVAALFSSTFDGSSPWWQGGADAEGRIELPVAAAGSILLVRHPQAGAAAVAAEEALRQGVRTLPPRAPDLVVSVVDRGGQLAPATGIALRCGGILVASQALAWLLETPLTSSDGSGHFRAAGLPDETIAFVAWSPRLQAEASAGQLAPFATPVEPRATGGAVELVRVE